MSNIVLCDIDGVLNKLDGEYRDLLDKKEYALATSRSMRTCKESLAVIRMVQKLGAACDIIFITGRHFRYKEETLNFLKNKFAFPFQLVMRPDNETPSSIFKKNWVLSSINPEDVLFAIEDRKDVALSYKEIKIKTIIIDNDLEVRNECE